MLQWIQERYGAEIVTLTVDLGQPGEDWDVVRRQGAQLGALDAIVADASEEFARDYVLPAIKANALYGGGYPLFTALGRPLIAKLAVEQARAAGCDTIAHGCTGKGNDQVRIDGDDRDAGSRAEGASRRCASGRWAARRRSPTRASTAIPIKGGTEVPPYSIDDNLWGRSSEGRLDRGPGRAAAPTTSSSSSRRPRRRRTSRELVTLGFERRRARCRSTASAWGSSS